MNVVAIRPQPTVARSMRASDRRIARVEILDDLTLAEPHWRALEQVDSLATPYQYYDFLKHWQRHVGSNSGMTPFIVVGFNQESEPLFLLPLCSRPIGGLVGLEFLGGKHANFNMALWRRDVAATIGADGLRNVLASLSGHADVLKLINQPLTWGNGRR